MPKKSDPLAAWSLLMKNMQHTISSNLNVSALGRVISVSGNRTDVQLLAQTDDTPPAILHQVMRLESVGTLGEDDVVMLTFVDLPMGGFFGDARPFEVTESRRHSINDAVIVGKVAL